MSNPSASSSRRPGAFSAARSRVADFLDRAGKAAALSRLALASPSEPAPPVDRAALVNYATFLAWERNRVCAELYPHLGTRGTRFVLGLNAADRFFHPSSDYRVRVDVPPASTRAVKVLDAVGIDWRSDPPGDGIERNIGGKEYADTGERPAVPYGWPAIDAALVEASANLVQLDAASAALLRGDARDAEAVPGYLALEDARTAALATLSDERAESVHGLQAKARAILTRGLEADPFTAADLGQSLARDLLAIDGRAIEPQPDPIFAAIDACRRLMKDGDDDALTAARDDLLQVVPVTAAGCRALARFAAEFSEAEGQSLKDADGVILALIARSPLR